MRIMIALLMVSAFVAACYFGEIGLALGILVGFVSGYVRSEA